MRSTILASSFLLCLAGAALADSGISTERPQAAAALVVAQGAIDDGRLSPRYDPVPPEEPCFYNDAYLFAMTRGLADSTIHPAGKAPLFLFTVPIDILLLPVTLISGFFG